jgi:hypothetical protein
MKPAAAALLTLAAVSFSGCRQAAPPRSPAPASPLVTSEALAPSPRLIVGRLIAVDLAQGFAFVDVAFDAPPAATQAGEELVCRTIDLRVTARLQARYLRGRTLGCRIVAGQPGPDDEVVWVAP